MKKGTKGKGQEKIVYKRTVDKAQIDPDMQYFRRKHCGD